MKRPSANQPDPRISQALAALNAHRLTEGIQLLEAVCQTTHKRDPQLWLILGTAYAHQGNMAEVIRYNRKVLEVWPRHVGALCTLGLAQANIGQQEQGARCFQQAMEIAPNDPNVYCYLAEATLKVGTTQGAIIHLQKALECNPDFLQAHKRLGQLYWSNGNTELAEVHFKRAWELDKQDADTLNSYILALGHEGEMDEALRLAKQGLADFPAATELLATQAHLLERNGDFDQAFAALGELEGKGAMSATAAATLTRLCRRFDCCDKALATAGHLLSQPDLDPAGRQSLNFALGALLDKLHRYDDAFAHFREANDAFQTPYDHPAHEQLITSLIDTFTPTNLKTLPRATNHDRRPIFIVGMPRSGTTLTEQILASHPDVYGAGELTDIKRLVDSLKKKGGKGYPTALADLTPADLDALAADYLQRLDSLAPESPRVTDKMPHNFLGLGLITLLFPEATLIHCRRNPLDNCLSIYFMASSPTHPYAADLEGLGLYYLQYERLMHHWKATLGRPILDVQYEDLVTSQEESTRRLLAHCGLEWNDACLSFHKTQRTVTTPSYDQVRKKLYTSSMERWRNYEPHIEPLIRTLAPLLQQG